VRRRAAAHTAVAGEAEAAAAEKAAAEKAAAEKADAEKAAAEKAAAAGMAAGARLCSKCRRPTKGHPRPFGDQCAADVLPSPEKGRDSSVNNTSLLVTPVKGEDREELCSCCSEPLTPSHQCDQGEASEEEGEALQESFEEEEETEDSHSEESDDSDICKQEGRRCRRPHWYGEYCTNDKCVCASLNCQNRDQQCKKCECSFETVTSRKNKKIS
jgi:hypothetical protein